MSATPKYLSAAGAICPESRAFRRSKAARMTSKLPARQLISLQSPVYISVDRCLDHAGVKGSPQLASQPYNSIQSDSPPKAGVIYVRRLKVKTAKRRTMNQPQTIEPRVDASESTPLVPNRDELQAISEQLLTQTPEAWRVENAGKLGFGKSSWANNAC